MHPNRQDTKIFDTKRNHKFLTETRPEKDRSAMAWLVDWKAQLMIVTVFGIIGGGFLYLGNDAIGWSFIGIVILLSSAFVCFRIVLPALKWLVGLVD